MVLLLKSIIFVIGAFSQVVNPPLHTCTDTVIRPVSGEDPLMRERGTLNPGNQHLTHLMLMSGIIINISHTHTPTHPQTYTETPCSPSHHLTYISTGGKFYPRAQCQHVCINKSTQNAHRLKELILSHYPFFSLYHSFMNSPSGSPSICPSASNPAKPILSAAPQVSPSHFTTVSRTTSS